MFVLFLEIYIIIIIILAKRPRKVKAVPTKI